MVVPGVRSDAAARSDLMAGLFLEGGFVDYFALGLRQVIHVHGEGRREALEVVPGATDGERGRVVRLLAAGRREVLTAGIHDESIDATAVSFEGDLEIAAS